MIAPLLIRVDEREVVRRFDPRTTFGACIDGGDRGETARIFTPANIRAMRSAGLRPLAYRLRTELAIEAWHWNPEGRFSEGDRGYWTSSDRAGKSIEVSFGYRLPRRGSTFDQANDDGYSRLTDGDEGSFWKSNPYLGDRPQWMLVRLPKPQLVDTIRIHWGEPYARRFAVDYWNGEDTADVDGGPDGAWRLWSSAKGRPGDQFVRLGPARKVRWVRLRLLTSSRTPRRAPDPRDARGFAIREVGIGETVNGRFVDVLVHRPDHKQSATWVSSTDPWHRAIDRDPTVEQPGLDLVFRSGLTNGLPVLMPAGVLYDTRENMAALRRWLLRRRYPVRGFEMGEEPDGQVCDPHDYAALFRAVGNAIRRVDARVRLGGPGSQTVESDYAEWTLAPVGRPVREGHPSWNARFVKAGRPGFVSFEWYPFDDVDGDPARQLAQAPSLLAAAFARLGLRPSMPLMVSEYGYSAFSGPTEVDLPAAILNLDIVGRLVERGAEAVYLYGYPPSPLSMDRPGRWGALALFLRDRTPLPTFWAARMMAYDWCGQGRCALLRSASADPLVSTFAVRRSDGRLAVLLLNRDAAQARSLHLSVGRRTVATGRLVQYGRPQYEWKEDGRRGRPIRDLPPSRSRFNGLVKLPPLSASVVVFDDPRP